jgi:class 3 adenylate cyclase
MDRGDLKDHVEAEGNLAIRRGALVSGGVALFGALVIPVLMLTGLSGLIVPWTFTLIAFAVSLGVWLMARGGRIRGRTAYVVLIPYVSLPTIMFLVSPSFMTGPISYVYLVVFAVVGFLFDFRLSVVVALVGAGGYFIAFLLGRDAFHTITASDPILAQDLKSDGIWIVKCVMIAFSGVAVGSLSKVATRLVGRMVAEESAKAQVTRLLGQHVGEEVKDRLLRDPLAKTGERKHVVVLFADIRSFTSYGERAQPEEIVKRLNAYFDAMVGAIHAHGGVVDKFIGDAVMATFGGLVDLPNACEAGVRAALEMRRRLRAHNVSVGGVPWDNGIGLHIGEVVLGSIGSADRKDYTVIGDCVNTASRVEAMTKDHAQAILVTGELHAGLPRELQAACVSVGEVAVRGRKAPLVLYGVPDEDIALAAGAQ